MLSIAYVQNLDELKTWVDSCQNCGLCKTRTQTVFGTGNPNADWMFIGEAPGQNEDLQGEPFVGRAGKVLNQLIESIGLKREDVYICNVIKCRPPSNRDPFPEEVLQCNPYLMQQIKIVDPKIIVAVGRIAAQQLLKTDVAISKLRGETHWYKDTMIPIVVMYHPAYLLRNPAKTRDAKDDLRYAQTVMSALGAEESAGTFEETDDAFDLLEW